MVDMYLLDPSTILLTMYKLYYKFLWRHVTTLFVLPHADGTFPFKHGLSLLSSASFPRLSEFVLVSTKYMNDNLK